jgi:O-antigen/teichoic acid export membrane protein
MTKNLFYNILLSLVNILFPIISFPYAAHILGPAGIGKVQFVLSFAQYFALFAALGIPIYGIKEIAKNRDNPKKLAIVFTELTSIFLITSILLSLVYVIVLFNFQFFSSERSLYLYAGVLILLNFSYTDWYYAGIEEFKGITLRSVVIKLISLILLYTLVKTESDYSYYLFITVFSIIGYQVLSFIMVFKKTSICFTDINLKKHLKPLFYLFGATLAASIYTVLDTVLLGFLSNNEAVGLYTASVKLIKITIPIITSLGVILIPAISKNFGENQHNEIQKLLDKSFKFTVFLSIPICFGLAILAPEFIIIFSGERFLKATSSMQILSLLPLLIGFGHYFCFQILMPSGRNKEIFLSMLAGVFACLILNSILVPYYQEVGASIANVITELIVTTSYILYLKRYYTLKFNYKFLLHSFVSALPFLPLIIIIRSFNLKAIPTLSLSIFTCAIFYIISQLLIFKNTFLFKFITPVINKIWTSKENLNE